VPGTDIGFEASHVIPTLYGYLGTRVSVTADMIVDSAAVADTAASAPRRRLKKM
jgi:hypothetical protein